MVIYYIEQNILSVYVHRRELYVPDEVSVFRRDLPSIAEEKRSGFVLESAAAKAFSSWSNRHSLKEQGVIHRVSKFKNP